MENNEFKFNLTNEEKMTTQELMKLLKRQAHVGGKEGHSELFTLSVSLLIQELGYLMIAGNEGEWDQKLFSMLGNDMKKGIEEVLKAYKGFAEGLKEHPEEMKRLAEKANEIVEAAKEELN